MSAPECGEGVGSAVVFVGDGYYVSQEQGGDDVLSIGGGKICCLVVNLMQALGVLGEEH